MIYIITIDAIPTNDTLDLCDDARIHRPTVADNDGPTILIRNVVSNSNTIRSLDDASIVGGTHLVTVAIVHCIFIPTNDTLDLCDDDIGLITCCSALIHWD